MKNLCYAQSGGPTAVINETARAVIQTAEQYPEISKVLAGLNGITGVLTEQLVDTSLEPSHYIDALRYTPAAAFRSCRFKLKDIHKQKDQYLRLIDVFDAHNIGYFLYNGGGDSQDTTNKISQICAELGYDIKCIGLPKTIDNDLPFTDTCPGFGSAAKYLATSIREASLDLTSMALCSTKVFILEVMGRHAGWLAASTGLAQEQTGQAPHIILTPEIAFDRQAFLKRVEECVHHYGQCSVVVSEGTKYPDGSFLFDGGNKDAFGHHQLGGGAAPVLAHMIQNELGLKYHWAVPDYLQRAARHIASKTDLTLAHAVGKAAVEFAIQGKNAVMPIIVRDQSSPYQWHIEETPLENVANVEKEMPRDYFTEDGMHLSAKGREYFAPLIEGEEYPVFKNGLPDYVVLQNHMVEKKLVPVEL